MTTMLVQRHAITKFVLLAAVVLLGLLLLDDMRFSRDPRRRRRLSSDNIQKLEQHPRRRLEWLWKLYSDPRSDNQKPFDERPVMHTFYQPVDNLSPSLKGTGMSDATDLEMIELWKEAWRAAGWRVQVLSLDEAKLHPDYDEYNLKLQNVPLFGQKRLGVNRFYNQLCYLRYLAMAAAGGGWMCDYDVLPIRAMDSRVDTFTVYDSNRDNVVPSLMSGRPEDWTRIAHAILENGLQHPNEDLWSDMFALSAIRESHLYDTASTVLDGMHFLTGEPWGEKECDHLKHYDAAHFSHNMIYGGKTREGETVQDRPRLARMVLEKLRKDCLERTVGY